MQVLFMKINYSKHCNAKSACRECRNYINEMIFFKWLLIWYEWDICIIAVLSLSKAVLSKHNHKKWWKVHFCNSKVFFLFFCSSRISGIFLIRHCFFSFLHFEKSGQWQNFVFYPVKFLRKSFHYFLVIRRKCSLNLRISNNCYIKMLIFWILKISDDFIIFLNIPN